MAIMAADDLATQGAMASATMIFTTLNRNNSVSARWQLINTIQTIFHLYEN